MNTTSASSMVYLLTKHWWHVLPTPPKYNNNSSTLVFKKYQYNGDTENKYINWTTSYLWCETNGSPISTHETNVGNWTTNRNRNGVL